MNWNEFLQRKAEYKKTWENLKLEYSGDVDITKFLNKSSLIVFYNFKQIEMYEDAVGIAKNAPDFFIRNQYNSEFIKIVEAYKVAEKDPEKGKKDVFSKQILEFDVQGLKVAPNRPEIRFPTVDMSIIQQLKKSKYCDQEATNMSRASIRVILIGGDRL